MHSILVMAKTFLKIFSKDRQAIFFTMFFPVVFMGIFGFLNTDEEDPMEIGVIDNTNSAFGADFIEVLGSNSLFEVTEGEEDDLRNRVIEGEMSLVLILPAGGSNPLL